MENVRVRHPKTLAAKVKFRQTKIQHPFDISVTLYLEFTATLIPTLEEIAVAEEISSLLNPAPSPLQTVRSRSSTDGRKK